MKFAAFATLILSLAVVDAQAAGYGEAGCGLGSVVMGPNGSQVMASTTNGLSYTNIFGVSSGTSNCTDEAGVKQSSQVPLFIEVNKMALQKESSRGGGETIANLANIMGCDQKVLGGAMKSHYKPLFVDSKMEPVQIQSALQDLIEADRGQYCGS